MHQISKEFNFEYGHRVWSQTLNPKFSVDSKCICRHLHGHSGTIKIGLEAETLTNGMVTDFKHLNFFKVILDDDFDHKFIIDKNDPLLENFLGGYESIEPCVVNKGTYLTMDSNKLKNLKLPQHEFEMLESFVIVNFLPTSENLTKFFYELIESKISELGVKVSYVEFWETKKSYCKYSKNSQ